MEVRDPSGVWVGVVESVALEQSGVCGGWALIAVGKFRARLSFVPLDGAIVVDRVMTVAHSIELVRDAPNVIASQPINVADHDRLIQHYQQHL